MAWVRVSGRVAIMVRVWVGVQLSARVGVALGYMPVRIRVSDMSRDMVR